MVGAWRAITEVARSGEVGVSQVNARPARRPRVVILGGGPAGVGAAFQLRRLDRADVTLVEARTEFGGNSGSFAHMGQRLDYGSHRLHPACDASNTRNPLWRNA